MIKNRLNFKNIIRFVILIGIGVLFVFLFLIPPISMTRIDTFGFSKGVYKWEDKVYLADDYGKLLIFDVSNPERPYIAGFTYTQGMASGVFISNDYLYLADGNVGLGIVSVNNSHNPENYSYIDTLGSSVDLWVENDYAYVIYEFSYLGMAGMVYERGISIIDVSNPKAPRLIKNVFRDHEPTGIFIDGSFLYLSDFSRGLVIINISDPVNPSEPVYMDTAGNAMDIFVYENYAFIADGDEGLAIIDITDPKEPKEPIQMDTTGDSLGIGIFDNYAYLADHSSGLAIINIENPTKPHEPVYVETYGTCYDLHVSEGFAYLANGFGGLTVINLSQIIEEIHLYNLILMITLIGLLILCPIGVFNEIRFFGRWIGLNKNKIGPNLEKDEKFNPKIMIHACNFAVRGLLIGSMIGLIFGAIDLLPGALISATELQVQIIGLRYAINFALFGAMLVFIVTPLLRGAFIEVSFGILIGLFIGGGIGGSMGGLNELILGLSLGSFIGTFVALASVVISVKLNIIVEKRKMISKIGEELNSRLEIIEEAALTAFNIKNYENYIQLRCLQFELKIRNAYITQNKKLPPKSSNLKDFLQKFEGLYNISLPKTKYSAIWDFIDIKFDESLLKIDAVFVVEFDEFFNLLNSKLLNLINTKKPNITEVLTGSNQ